MRCYTLIKNNICIIEVPSLFDIEVDVFIAGLGTAGAIAAIAAAEKGLIVIGAERMTGMGGIGTYGCVWDYFFGSVGGRFESINAECTKMLASGYVESDETHENKSYPVAVKSYVLEKNAQKAGCCLWYETVITGVYLEANKVVGVRCLRNGDTLSVKTGVIIDCTGEALLCRMAGCKMYTGRESDGLKQQFSKPIGVVHKNYIRGIWKHCGRPDKTDAKSLSDSIIKAGSEVPCLLENYIGVNRTIFEGAILGIRESSRIEAEEILSYEDFAASKKAELPVFYAFSPLDNLNRDIAFESEAHQDWHLMATMYNYGISVGIPMGTLIPKGIDGILVAGKGIGVDHDFATCIRMKKDFEKCGEAAAVIAYLAISGGTAVKDVPYEKLRLMLEESGCLDRGNDVGIADLRHKEGRCWRRVPLMTEPDDICAALATENTCVAMWSVRQLGAGRMLPHLRIWMKSGDAILSKNSAIAAGMLGDTGTCRLLRGILSELPFIPENHIKPQYYPDYTRVICLLGRLHDKASSELLLRMVESRAVKEAKVLKTDSFFPTQDDFAFQFISMSLVSLISIAKAHPDIHDMIAQRLKKWAADKKFSITISMGKSEMSEILHTLVYKNFGI